MNARPHSTVDELLWGIVDYERIETQRLDRIKELAKLYKRDFSKPKTRSSQSSKPGTNFASKEGSAGEQRRHPDKRPTVNNKDGLLKHYNCSQFGHISKNCPEPQKEAA